MEGFMTLREETTYVTKSRIPVFDSLIARKPPESLTIQRFRRFCLCCFLRTIFSLEYFFQLFLISF